MNRRKHLGIEVAVGMGDEGPGKAEDPRIAGKRPVGQFRQLAIVAGRQIVPDLADLLLDEVIIVEQPFRGGHDASAALQLRGARAIGRKQDRGIVVEAAWRERRLAVVVVTGCAAARLSACCSSRSTPKSSSLTGAVSFHGGAGARCRRAYRKIEFINAFPAGGPLQARAPERPSQSG